MYGVRTWVFITSNKGTANEYRNEDTGWRYSGPFETRQSAEGFARNIATQPDIARVLIVEEEDGE